MNPHALATSLRAIGCHPSSRRGSVALLLERLPADATPAQVAELTDMLGWRWAGSGTEFVQRVDECLDTAAKV